MAWRQPGDVEKLWDVQPRIGGTDREESSVVLHEPPRSGCLSEDPRHVRQQERRRSQQADVRGGHEPSGEERGKLDGDEPAADESGDAEESPGRLLG